MKLDSLTIDLTGEHKGPRSCGGCTLCCKLIPVEELHKLAGHRCKHQQAGKGCRIYERRPFSCRYWNCRWLSQPEDTATLSRPDRVHYVLDEAPDYITMTNNETGEVTEYPVLQVWVDPLYPDAHRDPALRKLLDEEAIIALIRYGPREGFTLWPPSTNTEHVWKEVGSNADFTREHSLVTEMALGLRPAKVTQG